MNKTNRSLGNILCIDDDEEYNFLTQEAFYDFEYQGQLKFMTQAEEAMSYLEGLAEFPDVIILDINMPIMNGWDFLDQFEARGYPSKHLTLIFMHSSSVFDSDRERALSYTSVMGFIDKPMELKDIEMIVRDFFGDNLPIQDY